MWLSPLHGRDSAYLGTLQYHRLPWRGLFVDVERALAPFAARTHWGKQHTLTAPTLRALYPRCDDLLAVRARLDPRGLFLGPHHESLLGVRSSLAADA